MFVLMFEVASCLEASTAEFWGARWWPVGIASQCPRTPTAQTVLGAPIVVWHDGEEWRTLVDRCPHRFARLSEGRVVAGGIECPYHGWRFDGKGACVAIPQEEASKPADKARCGATALETAERNGLVFAWTAPLYGLGHEPDYGALARAALDEIFVDEPGAVWTDYSRDLPMDATVLIENVLDPSHLPFTHDGTISRRAAARAVPFGPIETSKHGFSAERRTPGTRGVVAWRAPNLVVSRTERPRSFRDWNVVYAVPSEPGKCRLIVRVVFEVAKIPNRIQRALISTAFRAPPWIGHLSSHRVLEDDNVFLHHMNRDIVVGEDDGDYDRVARAAIPGVVARRALAPRWRERWHLATSADATVVAFRRWLDTYTAGRGVVYSPSLALDKRDVPAPSDLSRNQIIDRYAAHTSHCASCAAARRRVLQALHVAEVLSHFALVAAILLPTRYRFPVAMVSPLAFLVRKYLLRPLLDAFDRGSYPPPRNTKRRATISKAPADLPPPPINKPPPDLSGSSS
ncbi:hypothetical protein CTAYLR_008226 [Chrysophaeum taylorii]|uniref:Rieske domain-containing protein n=1 Tax=Chrysophaeum taylorii TaxID=2483200 RepID=A0AAD7UIC0_9STRA|nr:hypothetical protein CTAYLR_008226 [Chrysophaeum taylorii]